MGIQDRDYYRDGSRGFLDAWARQGAVSWIIIVTSAVFFLQCLTGGPLYSEVTTLGCFSTREIETGEVWRLITPLFLHANLWHLFCNMLVLYWAGSRLEEIYGSREFVGVYFVAGAFSHLVYLLAQITDLANPAFAIGASGSVMAVLVLFACHFPNQRVWLFFIFPAPVWLLVPMYVLFDLYGAVSRGGGIGYFAHLGGALFGYTYYKLHLRLTGIFSRAPKSVAGRARPTLRLLPLEADGDPAEPVGAAVQAQPHAKENVDEHLEAKLDRVLAKMSTQGQESLTAEEREILVKASELYKKRRK